MRCIKKSLQSITLMQMNNWGSSMMLNDFL